jgi:hypothetical protein
MRALPLCVLLLLSACMPNTGAQVSRNLTEDKPVMGNISAPPMPAMAKAEAVVMSNEELQQIFMDMAFKMESGRVLPVLTRFEGPITVRMIGQVPPSAKAELARLLARFRNEAGLDVVEVSPNQPAAINIDFQPRAEMRKVVPSAACFVVPRLSSFAEYKIHRNDPEVNWATVVTRTQVAVFVPSDTSAQEMRDCLHEEVGQAMGPLNDLYHLPNSVFNDDNFHTILTSFDMTLLRAYNAPELRSGMNATEVAARLPKVLARVNPRGQTKSGRGYRIAPRSWVAAVEQSFGVKGTPNGRIQAAEMMLNIAMAQGWRDTRLAFSYYAKGRALSVTKPALAVTAFAEAARIYRSIPGASVPLAHVEMQLAAISLASGQSEKAIQFADRALPVAQREENASLFATLMLIKAEAMENVGQNAAAESLRLDSLPSARYGFGSTGQIRQRQTEIAKLGERGRKG